MKNNQKILEIINSSKKDETILIIMVNWLHEYSEIKVKDMMELDDNYVILENDVMIIKKFLEDKIK